MTFSVFIDGEAGTTGLGIRERLASLPVTLLSIDPARRKDEAARQALMREADLVILCLPDEAARQAVTLAENLGEAAPRILDASSANRVAPGWTYGFAELTVAQPARIAAAKHVRTPGCYATGAIALLRPLTEAGLLPPDIPLYALGLDHKHVPETMVHSGLIRRPIFVPSVGHFRQGMLVSIPIHLDTLPGRPTGADLRQALSAHYEGSDTVQVVLGGASCLQPAELAGTDTLELHVFAEEAARHAVLVARLDNLGKGASGAAVQNLRLMLGLNER